MLLRKRVVLGCRGEAIGETRCCFRHLSAESFLEGVQLLLRLAETRRVERRKDCLDDARSQTLGCLVAHVPREMHGAALMRDFGQETSHGGLQPGVVVGDHQADAVETS